MPWYHLIPESWKKRACRYLLQRYVGHFLKAKLSLDQLSVDLYSGKGVIKELNLDVEALNDALESFNIPLEIVDGFIGSISVSIPWKSLLTESTTVEVRGLELTIQPKQWDESGDSLDTLSMLNSMHMTSSMQLAQEVLKSEKLTEEVTDEPSGFEGVQMFAQTIDTVLSRIKMTFVDTTIRLEHLQNGADKGVALELKIERMDYFDDIAVEPEGSPVDSPVGSFTEPAGVAHKNIHVMGVQLFFDEFYRNAAAHHPPDSPEISPHLFDSTASSLYKSTAESFLSGNTPPPQPRSLGVSLGSPSQPVLIAVFSGKQEVKAKLKQLDMLAGPKLELECQLGALHLLLSPQQLHGILDICSGLASPGSSEDSSGKKRGSKDKPMKQSDYQRVEYELQRHLQSGRLEQHQGAHMSPHSALFTHNQDLMMESIVDELKDEDVFLSMHGGSRDTAHSEMDSSYSSNYSGSTTRTASTATTFPKSESTGYPRQRSTSTPKSPKDHIQKLLDDPSAELSRYRLKLSFISVNILHENPTSTPGDQLTPEIAASEKLKTVADTYFNKAKMIAFSGMTASLKDLRTKFSEALPYDHIGILGKPLTLEVAQKTSQHTQSLSLDLTIGMFEAIECLFDRRNFTASMMGFSLPIDHKLPEYSELLVFESQDVRDGPAPNVMYTSMHGAAPAIKLGVVTAERVKSSSKARKLPNTKVSFEFGRFHSEVDITIVDRINSLLSPEPVVLTEHGGSVRFKTPQQQHTSVLGRQCFSQAMDEGPMTEQRPVDLHIASTESTFTVRFPEIDMRTGPQVMRRPWWQRNLHKEVLILELKNFTFDTQGGSTSAQSKMEFMCSDIAGYFQEDPNHDPILLATITSDDGCDATERGFNWPRLEITSSEKQMSVLEDEGGDSEDSLPMDSLNGACQFSQAEPSPFSARKSMYEQEDLSLGDRTESKHTSEEMVLPGDKEELKSFQDHCVNNTRLLVDVTLPVVHAVLPSKQLFEVIYNRVNNDLTLWEPSAPSPLRTKESLNLGQPQNLDIAHLLQQDKFQMAQSALQYDSGSDSDDDEYHYSIHDGRSQRRTTSKQQLPSKFCFSLNITKGKLLMVTPHKEETKHGQVCIELDDAVLFSVVSYNGDPDLRYVCFQANKAAMSNTGCHDDPVTPGNLDVLKQDSLPAHLEPRIYKSERGVASKSASRVGRGQDSPDMISLAIKIKLDTINNTKDFVVSVSVRGGTLRHKIVPSGESWISQCMDFLDVKDYPILGYTEPKVITELHVHLWSCAVDYRPKNLPQRVMLTAETFSISSNIVAQSPTTLLRFHLDDAALFLSAKKYMEADLKRDYVCVADLERFELSLRTSDGKDQKFPKTDLRISTNRLNIRTCADSCKALTELIRYFADDGDLGPSEEMVEEDDVSIVMSSRESSLAGESVHDGQMSESRLEQVHTLMADAMQESEGSTSSSESPDRQCPDSKTQVFFLPNTQTQGQGQPPPAGLRPIVISNSAESVTSSTLSDRTEKLSDEEEFCIIDDPGWGIAPRDGEPVVRVLTKCPVVIRDNYFSPPLGKTDQLKSPEHFPAAEYRYTLKELTVVWYMYGGRDFTGERMAPSSATPSPKRPKLPGHDEGPRMRRANVTHHNTWQSRGGPQRDLNTLMELQLTKVRCQHEVYPTVAKQASRQVLIISEFEVRDRLASSQINKFLYQYTSENMPKQTHANMLLVKALHTRPDSSPAQECSLRVSLLPLRLNIDQDALFFLRKFFKDLSGSGDPDQTSCSKPTLTPASPATTQKLSGPASSAPTPPKPPAPVMAVNLSPEEEEGGDQQDLLIMFDEMNLDGAAPMVDHDLTHSTTSSSGSDHAAQPVFFKSFIFTPDVPIRLDYHGKRVDMEQGTFAGLLVGLAQLNSSELKLKRLNYKHGLLGFDRVVKYAVSEWLQDIKKTQLPSILGGVGPMYSFVQIVHGLRDLFVMPVEQYRKDGRIVRGIQRGASSFTTSTAMALLELTNKLVQSIQYVAELTYDMLSPGPSVRKVTTRHAKLLHRRGQPSDMREGMTNAYIVIREGFSDTAHNLVRAATEEQEQKGIIGVAGGVLRQIPPTIVQPVIIATEATSKVLGGMRNQLRPEAKKEDEDKWRGDGKS